jgi:hypothetical protein
MCPIVEIMFLPAVRKTCYFPAKVVFLNSASRKAASHLVNLLIFPPTLASETAAVDEKNVAFVFNRPYPGS